MKLSSDNRDIKYLKAAAEVALGSTCLEARCGTVIVNNEEIIGKGYNSPPGNLESQRRCLTDKKDFDEKVTDKTCCVHAEQRALADALRNNPEKLNESKLYFIRIDEGGNLKRADKPYCTICSKMALDNGISEWILFQQQGVIIYDSEEYNNLSFKFQGN